MAFDLRDEASLVAVGNSLLSRLLVAFYLGLNGSLKAKQSAKRWISGQAITPDLPWDVDA